MGMKWFEREPVFTFRAHRQVADDIGSNVLAWRAAVNNGEGITGHRSHGGRGLLARRHYVLRWNRAEQVPSIFP